MIRFRSYAKRTRILLVLSAYLVLVPVIIFGRHSQAATNVQNAVTNATSHQPEKLTELYFTKPQSIPATYQPGQVIPASFSVHNLETTDMDYQYVVSINGEVSSLHSVHVKNGAVEAVQESVKLPDNANRVEVEVKLLTKNQSIHFWLEKE